MALTRRQILTLGPIVLVVACYAIAAPSRATSSLLAPAAPDPSPFEAQQSDEPLNIRCEKTTRNLRRTLPQNWNVVVREPYVLGGDMTQEDLEHTYHQTIVPTSIALQESYFRELPNHPITILICSSDEQFRDCNLRLESQELDQYSGLYSRKHWRIVVNIASGEGTLAHEMTHALAHVDFPSMPEWFDEGLASLHEECEFSADGMHLIGNANWRNQVAFDALNRGELRLIEDVTSKRFGTAGRANLDYAHVRSICFYLQEIGLLESYYKRCRANLASDLTGLRSLCEVADAKTPRAFDDAFRAWLIARYDRPKK